MRATIVTRWMSPIFINDFNFPIAPFQTSIRPSALTSLTAATQFEI
ncbi:hypothetical protein [Undibacterium sp. Ren11W]